VTRLIAIENTHNRCGGAALNISYTQAVGEIAKDHDLQFHIDGARIFNAAVAQGVTAKELCAPADSLTFCLSKSLCAPVGSVLCGSSDFIKKAHRIRKQLGGGMRQAGILAAAGIVALNKMVDRLKEDHERARRLAEGLATVPGLDVDMESLHTNMVYVNLSQDVPLEPYQMGEELTKLGVKIYPDRRFRLVTHYWVDDLAVDMAVAAFRQVLDI
jgi:threonine aldolase